MLPLLLYDRSIRWHGSWIVMLSVKWNCQVIFLLKNVGCCWYSNGDAGWLPLLTFYRINVRLMALLEMHCSICLWPDSLVATLVQEVWCLIIRLVKWFGLGGISIVMQKYWSSGIGCVMYDEIWVKTYNVWFGLFMSFVWIV